VLCHPDEVQDAEGSGGFRYWPEGLRGLPFGMRQMHRLLHRFAWDGGPVEISGTLTEGDEVAGFRVIELPGHAPGQIGLWRERDRLALSSDCFYTLDLWGRDSAPRVPEGLYNYDTEQARASIRKLAALEPAAAWPGHAKPLTGDVRLPARAGRRRKLSVGRRGRRHERLTAPSSDYTDREGNVLTLRGSLTPGARTEYARTLAGLAGRPSTTREDAWQRSVELLFERLAVRWVIAGVPIDRQRELLGRLRLASEEERAWLRKVLREHCAEHFPDVQAP